MPNWSIPFFAIFYEMGRGGPHLYVKFHSKKTACSVFFNRAQLFGSKRPVWPGCKIHSGEPAVLVGSKQSHRLQGQSHYIKLLLFFGEQRVFQVQNTIFSPSWPIFSPSLSILYLIPRLQQAPNCFVLADRLQKRFWNQTVCYGQPIPLWASWVNWGLVLSLHLVKKIPSEMEVAPRYNCWHCWHF